MASTKQQQQQAAPRSRFRSTALSTVQEELKKTSEEVQKTIDECNAVPDEDRDPYAGEPWLVRFNGEYGIFNGKYGTALAIVLMVNMVLLKYEAVACTTTKMALLLPFYLALVGAMSEDHGMFPFLRYISVGRLAVYLSVAYAMGVWLLQPWLAPRPDTDDEQTVAKAWTVDLVTVSVMIQIVALAARKTWTNWALAILADVVLLLYSTGAGVSNPAIGLLGFGILIYQAPQLMNDLDAVFKRPVLTVLMWAVWLVLAALEGVDWLLVTAGWRGRHCGVDGLIAWARASSILPIVSITVAYAYLVLAMGRRVRALWQDKGSSKCKTAIAAVVAFIAAVVLFFNLSVGLLVFGVFLSI